MKYCDDMEKLQIAGIIVGALIVTIVTSSFIGKYAANLVDDIVYSAKERFVMAECDECVEKARQESSENISQVDNGNDEKYEQQQ